MYGQNYGQQPFGFGGQSMPYMPDFRTTQNAQQQQNTNVSWIYVNGINGAKAQIVQPCQTAWMMDNNEPMIYVKAVDSMGTATLKAYRLNEINSASEPLDNKGVDLSEYVRKNDLNAISDRIRAIEDMIGGLNT